MPDETNLSAMPFFMSLFVSFLASPFESFPALPLVPQPVTFPVPVAAVSFPILPIMVVMMFLPFFLAAANNKEGK